MPGGGGEGRAGGKGQQKRSPHAKFLIAQQTQHRPTKLRYHPRMTFRSLPLTVREVKATEALLERLYASAKLGLKGDALALRAGLLPVEFRRLCQMDPIAEFAVAKGHADAEAEMATVVQTAALAGDAKMAMEYLKHRADWTAAQKVEVTGSQAISITLALEQATARVNSADVIDVEPSPPKQIDVSHALQQALQSTKPAHANDQVPAR